MPYLLKDYCNIKVVTESKVWGLVEKYNIPLPDHFIDQSMANQKDFQATKDKILGKGRERFKSLMEIEADHLAMHQPGYIAFADSCVEGKLDLDFVNLKYGFFMEYNLEDHSFRETKDPWQPQTIFTSSYQTLEQIIAFRAVILPFYQNRGHVFSKLRYCRFCKDFFITERKDNQYCGNTCKNAFHRAKYKQSK